MTASAQSRRKESMLPRHAALLLLTRFNAPMSWLQRPPPDAAWLEHRCRLFETFCLPAVQAQSFQEFRWVVYFDSGTPVPIRSRIESYQRTCRQFEPCFVDELDNAAAARAIDLSCNDDVRVVVTARLDNDDGVSRQFMASVASAVQSNEPERRFINMRYGYTWKGGRVFLQEDLSSPFFAVVEPRETLMTSLSFDHTSLAKHGAVQQIEDDRHYLQVVHDRNVSNSLRGRPREVSARSLLQDFPISALDVSQSVIRRVWWNGLGAISDARRTVRRALSGESIRQPCRDAESEKSERETT